MELKTCTNCLIEKSLDEFSSDKRTKSGKASRCKTCSCLIAKKYYEDNKQSISLNKKKYYLENKESFIIRNKKLLSNPEIREKYNQTSRIRWKEKYYNNTKFHIKECLRRRMQLALKGKIKSSTTINLLGCTTEELIIHLQNQFTKEMEWENYGSYWHIDHIIPCSKFDLTQVDEQKLCFHYTNLQPLKAEDNIRKGAK